MDRRIPLSDAQPGMTLAADAVNGQQMLLLKKGATLTENSLRTLKSWGVEAIWVSQPASEAERIPDAAEERPDQEQEIRRRFGDTLSDPVMETICQSAIQIVSERQILET